MAEFKYSGKDLHNKIVKGKIEGKSMYDVFYALKERGIYSYQLDEIAQQGDRSLKLKLPELVDFCRQVGTMLSAGIPITRAVLILMERADSNTVKSVYEKLYDVITVGNTLSSAMEECKNTFPPLMINMFKAGEVSGHLDRSAIKMADYYEKENKLNSKIKGAMVYPIILGILTVAVTILLFTFVIPNFVSLFKDKEVPAITAVILGISSALTNYWYVFIVVVVALVFGIGYILRIPDVALKIDEIKLKVPKIGNLLKIVYTARFARTLSSLYSSGINMIDAVVISAKIIGNRFVEKQFGEAIQKIRDGNLLSISIEGVLGIDKKLISSIYIGEETGKLDDILLSMADNYDFEADAATSQLITFIEPVMIVVMALIVGTVMMGVMMPIMTMYKSAGG